MAKTTLPTNYVDDVLNGAMDGKRRYREIPNADGTISLEDATTYDQIGNNFGASQLNLMNDNINQSFDANKMLKTMDEVNAVTQEGYGVDALVVKELNNSLKWKSIYNGAIASVNVNVENKEELRLRLLLSGEPYSPYISIGTDQTDGIWVLFCHVGNNIASVQFSIKDNVLSYVSHNFVGSWTINTFTLEVLAK